jgi:hypothetical protein
LTGSFLGDASENIITDSSEYSRAVGSGGAFKEVQSSERIIGGSEFSRGFDIDGTAVHSDEITSDTEDRGFLNDIFKKKKNQISANKQAYFKLKDNHSFSTFIYFSNIH